MLLTKTSLNKMNKKCHMHLFGAGARVVNLLSKKIRKS
jgi:hypothetical protein